MNLLGRRKPHQRLSRSVANEVHTVAVAGIFWRGGQPTRENVQTPVVVVKEIEDLVRLRNSGGLLPRLRHRYDLGCHITIND
jgi:hypothetical protein